MFTPASSRIEVRPLGKDSVIIDDKQELVELGEIVSIGKNADNYQAVVRHYPTGRNSMSESYPESFYEVGDILAFEGWGCTKITYKGEDRWVVSTDKNVILGKFTKENAPK